jgi:putative peptide zinc metalloprotease protein
MALEDLYVSTPDAAVRALASADPVGVSAAQDGDPAPRLSDGVELIGEFEDSGFKTAPYIARRADGQVVQMPKPLYQLAEHIDGASSLEQIAARFSHTIRRKVQAQDVRTLIDEQLRPLGIVARAPDGESIELGKIDPLLALKFRVAVVPAGVVRSLTTIFRPLFLPPVVALAVVALIGLDGWLFFVHGVTQSLRHVIYQPALMLMLIAGVIVATAFHEIGHATACRYGGAKPGVMGAGVYIVWPAFYTDITDAYRLGKWGRLRTDLGGMYFNAIFALFVAAVYAATSFEPLLLLIVLQNFAVLQQALPLLRLDGYYILSDLTGVPDIFLRIRAVLASLIPGRPTDPRVAELKDRVRVAVSAYVLLILAFLLVTVLALVINLPRIIATGYDSAALRYHAIGPAFSHGQATTGALALIEMVFLILPAAGLAYTAARVSRRSVAGAVNWSSGHPERQGILGIAGAVAIALAAFSWWPNGEYRPIQPAERGTIAGLFQQIAALPSGRASLSPERQRQLGGAPAELGASRLTTRGQAARSQPKRTASKSKTTAPHTSTTGAGRPASQAPSDSATPQPSTTATTTAPSGATTANPTATTTNPTATNATTTPTTSTTPGASTTTPTTSTQPTQ